MESNAEYFNSLTMKTSDIINKLFQSRDITHLAHLATKSYAEHKALNDYYDGIIDLTDDLVEMYQGEVGIIVINVPQSTVMDSITHLKELCQYIETNKDSQFKKSYLLNKVDEILGLIYSTIYKLENLK